MSKKKLQLIKEGQNYYNHTISSKINKMSDAAKEACAQAKAMADELGKQTRGIKVDMFKKLTTGLRAASSVLPGNPITREYDAGDLVATAGPGLHWKIYSGLKKSTKQEVSIFLFEKKNVDSFAKSDKDRVIELLRSGVSRLTRLRHPRILTVQHPLEESRESLAFCTEPVFASLANVLRTESASGSESSNEPFKDFKLHEVELKYGLLQLSEALAFLHKDVKMVHHNLAPENVLINKDGAWKLAGFECCISNSNSSGVEVSFPFPNWDPNIPKMCQPNLDYLAPEYFLTLTCGSNSDMYSMGILFHALFNNGRPVHQSNGSYSNLKSQLEKRKSSPALVLNNIPLEAREHVKLLLNLEPSVRPDADQLTKIPFFEDVGAMALHFLDTLFQKDNLARSKFYRGLPAIIKKLPKRVCLQRVLTCLAKELHHKEMIPFILPNIILVGEEATTEEYVTHVQPLLLPLMAIQDPIQVLLIFMQQMNLILKKTQPVLIKEHVFPMVFRALESSHTQIQELCLLNLPAFVSMLDYTTIKNSILPRIKKMATESNSVNVRVNCLVCLGQLLDHCEKWLVLDEILPMLPLIKTPDPGILMGILGIYKTALTHQKLGITREMLSQKILPFLIPVMMESSLSLPQFDAFSKVIHQMLAQIEAERRSQLEQLQTVNSKENGLHTNDFSESGLKEMLKGDCVGVTASSTSSATNSPRGSPTKAANTLSLEEKMRLAKEQENTSIMKKQSPIKAASAVSPPTTTANKTRAPQPKDLSGSLLTSPIVPPPPSQPRSSHPVSTYPTLSGLTPNPSRTGQVISQMPTPRNNFSALQPMPTPHSIPTQNFLATPHSIATPHSLETPHSLASNFQTVSLSDNMGMNSALNQMPQSFQSNGMMGMMNNPTPLFPSNMPGIIGTSQGFQGGLPFGGQGQFLPTGNPTSTMSQSMNSCTAFDGLLPFGSQGKAPSLNQMAIVRPATVVQPAPVKKPAPPKIAPPAMRPLTTVSSTSSMAMGNSSSLGINLNSGNKKADASAELNDLLG